MQRFFSRPVGRDLLILMAIARAWVSFIDHALDFWPPMGIMLAACLMLGNAWAASALLSARHRVFWGEFHPYYSLEMCDEDHEEAVDVERDS